MTAGLVGWLLVAGVTALVALCCALLLCLRALRRSLEETRAMLARLAELPTAAPRPAPVLEATPVEPAAEPAEHPGPAPPLGELLTATLAGPLVKAAALSYGLRRALDQEHRDEIADEIRRELRARRRSGRAGAHA
jgi:glucose/arabinose dehydrogenase